MFALNPKINNTGRHITFHVNMDNLFASMEVRGKPELKSLPIGMF
jgi:hypothetical protein